MTKVKPNTTDHQGQLRVSSTMMNLVILPLAVPKQLPCKKGKERKMKMKSSHDLRSTPTLVLLDVIAKRVPLMRRLHSGIGPSILHVGVLSIREHGLLVLNVETLHRLAGPRERTRAAR